MSSEQSVALVRRYFAECVNELNGPDQDRALAVLDDLMSPDFVMAYNNDTDARAVAGRDRHKQFLVEHASTFPNDRWTVEAIVADEKVVACQWHIQATHAKTRNPIDVRAADFFLVRDARLAGLRRFLDFKSLREQVLGRGGR